MDMDTVNFKIYIYIYIITVVFIPNVNFTAVFTHLASILSLCLSICKRREKDRLQNSVDHKVL